VTLVRRLVQLARMGVPPEVRDTHQGRVIHDINLALLRNGAQAALEEWLRLTRDPHCVLDSISLAQRMLDELDPASGREADRAR
jgi:hypothetical protein